MDWTPPIPQCAHWGLPPKGEARCPRSRACLPLRGRWHRRILPPPPQGGGGSGVSCLPLRGRCQRRVTPAADGRGSPLPSPVSLRTSAAALVWQSVSFVFVGEGLAPPADMRPCPTDGRAMLGPTEQTNLSPYHAPWISIRRRRRHHNSSLFIFHSSFFIFHSSPRPNRKTPPARHARRRRFSLFPLHCSLFRAAEDVGPYIPGRRGRRPLHSGLSRTPAPTGFLFTRRRAGRGSAC